MVLGAVAASGVGAASVSTGNPATGPAHPAGGAASDDCFGDSTVTGRVVNASISGLEGVEFIVRDTDGLTDAVRDWSAGDLTTEELQAVVRAWSTGE